MGVVDGIVMIAILLSAVAFFVVALGAVLFIGVLGLLALSAPPDDPDEKPR